MMIVYIEAIVIGQKLWSIDLKQISMSLEIWVNNLVVDAH